MNTRIRTTLAAIIAGTVLATTSACVIMPPPVPDNQPIPMPMRDDGPKPTPSDLPAPDITPEPGTQPDIDTTNLEEACLQLFNSWFQFTPDTTNLETIPVNPAPQLTDAADPICTTTFLNLEEAVPNPDTNGWEVLAMTLITNLEEGYAENVNNLAIQNGMTQVADETTLPDEEPRLYGAWAVEKLAEGETPPQPKPSTPGEWTYGEYLILAGPDIQNYENLVEQFREATGVTITLDDRILIHGEGWYPNITPN